MEPNPSEIGAVAEREVSYALGRAGYDVYLPMFGPHSRVDLVAYGRGELLRVQVKSARMLGDVVYFRTCSNTKNIPRAYRGEVDAFGVFSPDLGRCFLVPNADLPERGCSLRLAPPRNGQRRGIRRAADFEVVPVVDQADGVSAGGGGVGTMRP